MAPNSTTEAWLSLREKMAAIGCIKSFVLPATPHQYAGWVTELRAAEEKKKKKKTGSSATGTTTTNPLNSAEGATGPSGLSSSSSAGAATTVLPPLNGRIPADNLSTVLALPTPFLPTTTTTAIHPSSERVDWPTPEALFKDGDDRVRQDPQLGRFLPVPRRNTPDPRAAAAAGYRAISGDQKDVPPKLRQMVPDRWDFHPEERMRERYAARTDSDSYEIREGNKKAKLLVGGLLDQEEE